MAHQQHKSPTLAQLAAFAAVRDPGRLGEIYLAVTRLIEEGAATFSERERTLATDIVRHLSKDVEMSIRIALAERLAISDEAPRELIVLLADDIIDVARPVLLRSATLTEDDLLRTIDHGTDGHQVAVAERPHISEAVSALLAQRACEAAVISLLRNESARIGEGTFCVLGERARKEEWVQGPLVERSDLPPAIAAYLYESVSTALRATLMQRYPQIAMAIGHAVDQAAREFQDGTVSHSETGAIKLVAKLQISGDLRPSFLLRVLHQGQMDLFEHGFAALLKMDVAAVRKVLYGAPARAVALACRAAGIDRAVFMTVFHMSRHHKRLPTGLTDGEQKEIQAIFSKVSKSDALNEVKMAAA